MKQICALLLLLFPLFGQITPGKIPQKSILYIHGQIHDGKGKWIKDGALGVKQGKITLVKDLLLSSITKSDWDSIVDLKGQHIYPGFIACNSSLGMQEIDAVRATNDLSETGKYLPQLRTISTYNTDSRVTSTVRSNGILIAQITPRAGILKGRSSVVQLDAWNWEDAAVSKDRGLWMIWPKDLEELQKLKSKISNALKQKKVKEYNSESAALVSFFNQKDYRLYIEVNASEDILAVIAWSEEMEIKNIVLVGAAEAYQVSPILKYHKVPIILDRMHRLPDHEDDELDQVERNALALLRDSIPFAISMRGGMERMNTRNLGFQAGQLMQLGLEENEVLPLITYNAAKILGIDQFYGSIEVDKSATFFISKGTALDMRSLQVTEAFVQGRKIHLTNPQTLLRDKYEAKYSH